tara:strand:+ start:534 stop:650 length:117 start_codon:yes stop_codon:yes gene_type:complete
MKNVRKIPVDTKARVDKPNIISYIVVMKEQNKERKYEI